MNEPTLYNINVVQLYPVAVVMGTDVPFEKVVMTTEEYRKVASPRQSANEVYKKMAASYAELEDRVIKEYAKKHVLK